MDSSRLRSTNPRLSGKAPRTPMRFVSRLRRAAPSHAYRKFVTIAAGPYSRDERRWATLWNEDNSGPATEGPIAMNDTARPIAEHAYPAFNAGHMTAFRDHRRRHARHHGGGAREGQPAVAGLGRSRRSRTCGMHNPTPIPASLRSNDVSVSVRIQRCSLANESDVPEPRHPFVRFATQDASMMPAPFAPPCDF